MFVLPDTSYGGTSDNHGQSDSYNNSVYGRVRTNDDNLIMLGNSYYGDTVLIGWAANYLGTINNLASAITKTAAQSMKIV